MEEFRDMVFGDVSKSESERYRKDSLRWLWGKEGWSTNPGLACESMGLRPGEGPFSESKLKG